MPKNLRQKRFIPPAVQNALQALAVLRLENKNLAAAIEKKLPGYAVRLDKEGADISIERLLVDARRGLAFLKTGKRTKIRPQKTYQSITGKFKAVPSRSSAKSVTAQLAQAAKEGDIQGIDDCLARGALINRGDQEVSAFEAVNNAAWKGHLAALKYLKKRGFNLHEGDDVAFRSAAEAGELEVVKYLIEEGADINAADGEALRMAAGRGRIKIVECLVEQGADIHVLGDDAVTVAAGEGQLDVLKYLHQQGGDVHAYNEAPFCIAVENGHLNVVRYFVEDGGVAPGAEDGYGLRKSIEMGHFHIAKYLLKAMGKGANVTPEQRDIIRWYNKGCAAWKKTWGIDPPPGLYAKNPKYFNQSAFESVCEMLALEGYKDEVANNIAFFTAALFGSEQKVLQYLDRWGAAGRQPLHDLVYMIEVPATDGLQLDDWRSAVLKCGPSMATFVKFADKLPSPLKGKNGKAWSVANTRAETSQFIFVGAAQNRALASLCVELGVSEHNFENALAIVKQGAPRKKNIPDIVIAGEEFGMPGAKFYRLPSNDIRGLFLGEITDCCQSIGSVGAECAEHGYTSKDGGFYIVENAKGKIIGETWAWRGNKGEMCFDSVETLGREIEPEQWERILVLTAQHLAKKKNHTVTSLTVGTGGATPESLREKFAPAARPAAPKAYHGYRDSKNQLVVWEKYKRKKNTARKL